MSSIFRTGLTSPRSIGTRSILKRPASIAVSTPSSPVQAGSPHVRFAPTPTLTASFTTFTSNAYDRSSIVVQPNPLALPEPGDRVFSPTMGGFKPTATRSFRQFSDFSGLGFSAMMSVTSPLVSDFEDPRSPKVTKASGVKFAPVPQMPVRRTTRKAAKTDQLSSLPRSPFPSDVGGSDVEAETQGFEFELSDSDIESAPRSFEIPKRNKKGLTLGGSKIGSVKMSISSPCTHLGKLGDASAVGTSTLKRSNKPAPLSLAYSPQSSSAGSSALTQQFWDAMSIHEPETADVPMYTAFENPSTDSYPEDAVSYEKHNEKHLKTATAPPPPPPLYAGADGVPTSAAVVWSPTLPRRGAAAARIRDSLMSPTVFKRAVTVQRREITAPSPNDPFAAFPSFAAAFEGLQVPQRVAVIH